MMVVLNFLGTTMYRLLCWEIGLCFFLLLGPLGISVSDLCGD